jgi:hypothetical protein
VSELVELPEPQEIRRVVVKPGDVLVIRYLSRIQPELIPRIVEQIRMVLGEGIRSIIIDGGGTIDVLEPPEKSNAKARELDTGELGSWKPEYIRAVDALREFDWVGFDPTNLDDLAEVAGTVASALQPPVDFADVLPPSQA